MLKVLTAIIISTFFLSTHALAEVNDSAIKIKWSYKGNNGPEKWGELTPAFALCSRGKLQSPINITHKIYDVPHQLQFHYLQAPLEIVDDGTTNLTLGKAQMLINDGHGIQVNFDNHQSKETITFKQENYHLIQFHIHSPSENQLQGATYPLEIHLVHQGDHGQLAVIGVFVKNGNPNPLLQKMVEHLPKTEGKEEVINNITINPIDLIPKKQHYYSFMGSLTTPPCTEGVQWIVMPEVITASSAQILLLRQASGGGNARPVQALNKRKIFYSANR